MNLLFCIHRCGRGYVCQDNPLHACGPAQIAVAMEIQNSKIVVEMRIGRLLVVPEKTTAGEHPIVVSDSWKGHVQSTNGVHEEEPCVNPC